MRVLAADADALRIALRRGANDLELRLQLGQRARVTVERRYNLAVNLDLQASMWTQRLSENL
jgi:hypothetical protein